LVSEPLHSIRLFFFYIDTKESLSYVFNYVITYINNLGIELGVGQRRRLVI